MVGEVSYKRRLLATSFKHRPKEERHAIHKFAGSHVDWRWELLEDVVVQVLETYGPMCQHFKAQDFPGEGRLVVNLLAALSSTFFKPFSAFLAVFMKAIGREASWFEGSYETDELNVEGVSTYKKRCALRMEHTGEKISPWGGKRVVSLALGHAETMVARVRSATSAAFTETLLQCDVPEVVNRVLQIQFTLNDQWGCEVLGKLDIYLHIPYIVTGAFGSYCGQIYKYLPIYK